jgi:hypothetical protein
MKGMPIMSGNNIVNELELDQEKLKEAYRKVDRMFGIDSREPSGNDTPSANEKACKTNLTDSKRLKPYLLTCLALFGILIVVLLVVFLDDVYLFFTNY